MSLSRELQLHITQLKEIRSILNAMKNLAFMEIHKLLRFNTMQGQSVTNIECVALDFIDFYPQQERTQGITHICILLGAERGFCGDFNESLIAASSNHFYTGFIVIGSRLCNRLENITGTIIAKLEGANIAEEVPAIINRLLEMLTTLADVDSVTFGKVTFPSRLTIVYHDVSRRNINLRQILPLVIPRQENTVHFGCPPLLNFTPEAFFTELVEQYLCAVLHEIFYSSLSAENQHRLQHLEAAVNHLDDETIRLQKKSQIYRQEEITEEIEVILLNAENNLLE